MAAATVTFDGTRVNDAEATTNWTAATATPTLEPDFRYQNANCISAQIKTTETGFYFRNSAVTHNFSSPKRVWLAKVIATNKDALDGNGLVLEIGSGARTNYYRYFVYSATTYPIAGGWQIVPIDPNVAGYRSATVGTPTLTALDMFGAQADFNATSKAPNLGVDAIDYFASGEGLTLTGGDGVDADGTFQTFVTADEGTVANRWGVISTRDGILYVVGTLSIGSGSAAVGFQDSNRVLVFPDGRFDTGFTGIKFNLSNAQSTASLSSCIFRGRGVAGTSDTRPDYTIISASGRFEVTASVFNTFRNMTLSSSCFLKECTFLSGSKIFQSGSTLLGCSFSAAATADGTAHIFANDPSKISESSFVFSDGHAIEIVSGSAGTYSFTANVFTGYGANETNDAAIYNNSSGSVTLNITGGGSTPTVRNGVSATTTINNAVTLTVTVKDSSGSPISGARVAIYTDNTGEVELLNDITDGSGAASTSYAYVTDQPVFIRIRSASGVPAYLDVETSATITSSGLSVQVTMQTDTNV